MVDDVIRAFIVSQGFCLLMAMNQEEAPVAYNVCVTRARNNTYLFTETFFPVFYSSDKYVLYIYLLGLTFGLQNFGAD